MKRIKIGLWAFILGISALWFLADSLLPQPFNYFSFRYVFNQYSGVLAMGAMSLCMLLSIRAKWLENVLQGLDKGYRLHKWLGITALVSALAHFWFTKGTKWMVGWGWLTRPERKRPQGAQQAVQTLEQWLGSMRGVAESVGEWAFYVAAVLMMMALIKAIPYHWFVKLHKWLALAYLALVFHAVVLLKFEYWTQPIGWVMAILLMGGVVSALWVLLKRHNAAQARCKPFKRIPISKALPLRFMPLHGQDTKQDSLPFCVIPMTMRAHILLPSHRLGKPTRNSYVF